MDTCVIGESNSSHKVTTVLESLYCYNDFQSYLHCVWKEERHTNKSLQLHFKHKSGSQLCEPYSSPVDGTSQCRYKTKRFAKGTNYTAFFKNETLSVCSSVQQQPLNLSLLLRAHPPVNLTTSRTEDGGRLITWSSPYPASSILNRNITYKLSHRAHGQDSWTTEELSEALKQLEKKLLSPGQRYEARVKARVSAGHWSHWTPVVSWHTEPDPGQVPSVECVVSGEQEVMCSWEMSRELVHFISYQLACRANHSAPFEICCKEPVVSPGYRHSVLKYTCSLKVKDLSTHLLLELKPTRNSKTFRASKHIRPYPPTQVNVTENGQDWIVEWTPPKKQSFTLNYCVCYYSTPDEDSVTSVDIPEGSTSLTIPGSSLLPSQSYMVKVRSLVLSKNPDPYEGTPSDWSLPVEWTTHAAVWSISNWIYVSIGVIVAAVFLTLYCTIPACQRRAVLWAESVPSPGKSKIMSDIQTVAIRKIMLNENTYTSKVFGIDTVSTCSLNTSLWSTKDTERECLEVDEGVWNCCDFGVTSPDTSTNSFSGPYIFCQVVESKPMDDSFDQEEGSFPVLGSPVTGDSGLFEEGYVCLPRHDASRSIQDLTSHSHSSTDDQRKDIPEPELNCSNDTSGPFWPKGGTITGSGYCQMPTDFMRTPQ